MLNLTAKENNLTSSCGFCLQSFVAYPTTLPYILISLPTNGRVLWLMISSPVFWTDRMKVSEFHLVLTELIFGFLGPPLMTVRIYSNYEVADITQKLVNGIFIARVQFQSSVCIERYLAVVHPVLYLTYRTLRYRMSLCCVIWLETILVCIVQMFFCSEKPESLSINLIFFFGPFMINSFCCLSILRALKQPTPGKEEREGSNLIKKRAFNIVLIFLVTTFVGLVPLVTMSFLVREMKWNTFCTLEPLAYAVMVWVGAIYPLLYLYRAEKHLVKKSVCVNCFRE